MITNCQVLDFVCYPEDLCPTCGGTGEHPQVEMCCCCDDCFDEQIGWATGIKPGSVSAQKAREFVAFNQGH